MLLQVIFLLLVLLFLASMLLPLSMMFLAPMLLKVFLLLLALLYWSWRPCILMLQHIYDVACSSLVEVVRVPVEVVSVPWEAVGLVGEAKRVCRSQESV